MRILIRRILSKLRHHQEILNEAAKRLDYRLLMMLAYRMRKTVIIYWYNNLPKRDFETMSQAYYHLAFEITMQISKTAKAKALEIEGETKEMQILTSQIMRAISRNFDEWTI